MPFIKYYIIPLFLFTVSVISKADYHVVMRKGITAKHPKNFQHIGYVNPKAPKKGTLNLPVKKSTFNSFNPFIVQGIEASGLGYLHASLMKVPLDDQMVAYPYVAKEIIIAPDYKSVTFILQDKARFSDGSVITAKDVEFSYKTLKEKGRPNYRIWYDNITSVDCLSSDTIRFNFKKTDLTLPFLLAKMRVLSKKFYTNTAFDKTNLIPPVGSGPYKIKNFENGKYIIYERIKDWWASDLPIVKGLYNFDTIKFVHYYNYDTIVDGLKRGEVDHNIELKVSRWENKYDSNTCEKERIIKREFAKPVPHGLNAFFFNARRPHLCDPRVRKALNLLFNFNWINKTLFNNRYKRSEGIFNSKDYNAQGNLSDQEKRIMQKMGLKNIHLYETLDSLNKNNSDGVSRENMDHAIRLLAEAGWSLKGGVLTHKTYGKFSFEILLPSTSMIRFLENYINTLNKVGIKASIKAVDLVQFENRLCNFDYDLVLFYMPVTYVPGKSLENIWGSKAVDIKGSYNLSGVKDSKVDQVINKIITAKNLKNVKLYASILDRIIRQKYYYIPAWYRDEIYVAYRDKFRYIDRDENGYSVSAWWLKE